MTIKVLNKDIFKLNKEKIINIFLKNIGFAAIKGAALTILFPLIYILSPAAGLYSETQVKEALRIPNSLNINDMKYISLEQSAASLVPKGKFDKESNEIRFNGNTIKAIPGCFFIKYTIDGKIVASQLLMPAVQRGGKTFVHLDSFIAALKSFGILNYKSNIDETKIRKKAVNPKKIPLQNSSKFPNLKIYHALAALANPSSKEILDNIQENNKNSGNINIIENTENIEDIENTEIETGKIIEPEISSDNHSKTGIHHNNSIDESISIKPFDRKELSRIDFESAKRRIIELELRSRLKNQDLKNPPEFYIIPKKLIRPEIDDILKKDELP